MASLSRSFARWVAGLHFEHLPGEVVDRAKGATLQAISSALLGSQTEDGRRAVALITEEEAGVHSGATILVCGARATNGGAAFANSELTLAGGKWDTFRMLTHPGTSIVPAALAAAESRDASGEEFITGIAAGYEVMERLASDFIPTVMSRGFHAGPVFGIFGAAVAAGKIMGLNEEQLNSAIALCASLASGNLEGPRSGGQALREGGAVRNALLAAALAERGHVGGETVLEGEAGFYHAYTGNNEGRLTYSFTGDTRTSLNKITEGLGEEWLFLETLFRIYSTSGYNLAHIDVTASLCEEHDIHPEEVERVETEVNWLETQYPSPAFPNRREDGAPRPGGTHYYAAFGVVKRGYPLLNDPPGENDPPEVLAMMERVRIIPSREMGLFAPRVSIQTKERGVFTKQATGQEFIFRFDELANRIGGIAPGLPIPEPRFREIIETCRALEAQEKAEKLIRLTVAKD